jgi:hypothetical protein
MFRIDDASAQGSLPAPEAAGAEAYFTEGNPIGPVPATPVRASWLNMIQEELRAIVVAAAIIPSKSIYNQVLTAINALIAAMPRLGVGQSWQNMTASRAIATVYTNTTGGPIMLSINVNEASFNTLVVGGLTVVNTTLDANAGSYQITSVIPNGTSYSMGTPGTILSWFELR